MEIDGSDEDSAFGLTLQDYALHNAAEAGDAAQAEQVLASAARDADFDPEAAQRPDHAELDIDELDDSDCSPLHIALLKGHLDVARLLLAKGASVRKACEGSPPLVLAVCTACHEARQPTALEAVQLLLSFGASALQRDDNGRTAFHWAAWLGWPEALPLLQEAAAAEARRAAAQQAAAAAAAGLPPPEQLPPPNLHAFQDKQGNTPLHLAAASPSEGAAEALLAAPEGAAAAAATNKQQQAPLHLAAAAGRLQLSLRLKQLHPKALGAADKQGHTPGQLASSHGHPAVAAALASEAPPKVASLPLPRPRLPTLVVAPPACRQHYTAPEPLVRGQDVPPENRRRLEVLTHPEEGILRAREFGHLAWDEQDRLAPIADVLRVHEWAYVRRIQRTCAGLPDDAGSVGHLDADTVLSRGTWAAALAGVGALCHAIDAVADGSARNAFCAIRPPGHHAGPLGTVTSANDPAGSQGFCFFNNLAVAAAYAMNVYRRQGIRRVALLDFDVHHGNGTQACMARVVPQQVQYALATPLSEGSMTFPAFHPWLDADDRENLLFASVQGYGKHAANAFVYPGSGATCDTQQLEPRPASAEGGGADADGGAGDDVPPENPDLEFATVPAEHPSAAGPRVINVGVPGPGAEVALWRRAWRDKILPAVADFRPDLILVSAGFDAHRKDELNCGFIGVTERDYAWLTRQLVSLAAAVCGGRLVSALEGGYRIQGGIVSAFSRSVAAHVRALAEFNGQEWSLEEGRRQRTQELQRRREVLAARRAKLAELERLAVERALELQRQAAAAAAAAAAAGSSPSAMAGVEAAAVAEPLVGQGLAGVVEAADDDSGRKRRRRGAAVDYAALNLRLEEEARLARLGAGGGGAAEPKQPPHDSNPVG